VGSTIPRDTHESNIPNVTAKGMVFICKGRRVAREHVVTPVSSSYLASGRVANKNNVIP